MELCASPPCYIVRGPVPTMPEQVCGLKRDGTDRMWALVEPDELLLEGWRAENVSEIVIAARVQLAKQAEQAKQPCAVRVVRDTRVRLANNDEDMLFAVLTKNTNLAFRWGTAIYEQRREIVGLGIGGALICSFFVIVFFTCCVRYVLLLLLMFFFIVLIAADYILFLQAGIFTGNTGRALLEVFQRSTKVDIPDSVEELLRSGTGLEREAALYKWSGVVLALRSNFEMLVALLSEASYVLRRMPSLLVLPWLLVASMMLMSLFLMEALLGFMTIEPDAEGVMMRNWCVEAESFLMPWVASSGISPPWTWPCENLEVEQVQQVLLWTLICAFLWAYFFHVALFISVTAMAVSEWYFYRDDVDYQERTSSCPGRSIIYGMSTVFRYHLGSLAFGSLLMTLATLPRIILEYIARETGAESNACMKAM
eukprot:CAMPEP_0180794990 /NCGR_PEP_ID=MMETSP1038_2-20121128/55948_1 /TAXON_ID=632150 /ORGANISM="Azadinium spinosum, Strain 3D9" /LENGTH=424 /DNA_ID=CAMNT_0022833855 /DNA_START=71 /DNA_END=1342 /DNA_ORIENTATION=-